MILFVFIIGLCIGSFLNVVILRGLGGESIVFPSSKCPQCQTPLKPWHNIPVISYALLRGKCAFCAARISPQYPIIELATGITFVLAAMRYGLSLQTLFAWVAVSVFIAIAGTDIREKVVFTTHTYILVGLGLLNALIAGEIISSLLGILAGIVIMEAAARSGYLLAGTRAFGEGDTFIAAGLGAMFGWKELLFVLALSLFVQLAFTLPVFVKKLFANKDYKTLVVTVVFCVYALVFFFMQLSNVAAALILAALGVYLCKLILAGLKENPQDLTYLPFGPAMVIAGLVMLIF